MEAWEVLTYAEDWKLGVHPVSTGRAPWLPTPFIHAIHFARWAENEEHNAALRRAHAKVK